MTHDLSFAFILNLCANFLYSMKVTLDSEEQATAEKEDSPSVSGACQLMTDSNLAQLCLSVSLNDENSCSLENCAALKAHNTDSGSLTNVSESGKEEESSRGEVSSFMSDDEENAEESDDDARGAANDDENDVEQCHDNRRQSSTTSSSCMVRSNTFDMLCQKALEGNASTDNDGNSSDNQPFKEPAKSTVQNSSKESKPSREGFSLDVEKRNSIARQNSEGSSSADLDAETPIAEQPQQVPSSPGTMFQFFIDMDSMGGALRRPSIDRHEKMTRSGTGFMFIDLNKVRKKNMYMHNFTCHLFCL